MDSCVLTATMGNYPASTALARGGVVAGRLRRGST